MWQFLAGVGVGGFIGFICGVIALFVQLELPEDID